MKVILVCRALIKVFAHKDLASIKPEYPYITELDLICKRLIEKYEKNTEDGVEEGSPEE
jgi:hypothetical protein